MNFKQTLVHSNIKNIELMMNHGKTLEQSLQTAKDQSCAGQAVWEEVEKHFEELQHV